MGRSQAVAEADLPDGVASALPGVEYLVELSLEPAGAPKPGLVALKKAAGLVAAATHAVIVDRQRDTMDLPEGVTRFAPPPSKETPTSVLENSWWFEYAELLERARLERVLDALARFVPEALPERYGPFEPPAHVYAKTGREHLIAFLCENMGKFVVWRAHAPVYGLSYNVAPTWGWVGPGGAFRSNRLAITLDADCLKQPGWPVALAGRAHLKSWIFRRSGRGAGSGYPSPRSSVSPLRRASMSTRA